jgi:hypothetical protein
MTDSKDERSFNIEVIRVMVVIEDSIARMDAPPDVSIVALMKCILEMSEEYYFEERIQTLINRFTEILLRGPI